MPSSRISVVIPTRDRAATLRLCLAAVLEQISSGVDEVLVVDDGSTDETVSLQAEIEGVTWLRVEGLGTCAARNLGVAHATGDVVLFIDDDIVCSPGLIERHRDFHIENASAEETLVGHVTWDPSRPITKHMVWLEDGGPLFAFNLIEDNNNVDPHHFCTSNVSVKKELLGRVDGPFDERIKRFTDVELAMRLAKVGLRLHYDPEAVAWHLRVDTPATTDQRMFEVGKASKLLDELHPGVAPPAAPRTVIRGLKAGVAKILSPITPVLPAVVADRIWSSRAAWAYSSGRAAAESSR